MLSHSVVSDSLRPYGLQPTRLLCPWGFSRPEYWSGFPCPPPGDLPDPGIQPRSPALQVILYQLSHQGRPGILVWVDYPFSRGSSQPRNQTGISCIAGRFFTHWATRERWGTLKMWACSKLRVSIWRCQYVMWKNCEEKLNPQEGQLINS